MSIASLIRSMTEAGAPLEAIALAVEAIEARDAEIARRREQDRDRKRKQRERSRDSHGTVTGQSADSHDNAPLSPPNPPTPPNTPPIIPPDEKKARASSRGSRLPRDWQPSADEATEAERLGIPSHLVPTIADRFRDYWTAKAGADACKTDWTATWRNWCRREAERMPQNNRGDRREQPYARRGETASDRTARNLMAAFAAVAGSELDRTVVEEPDQPTGFNRGGTVLDLTPAFGGRAFR